VESALGALHRAGVYLTLEEFKGRRLVRRGSSTVEVDPRRLWNSRSAPVVYAQSSGSRGSGTPVPVTIAGVRDTGIDKCVALDARGGLAWAHAVWGVPGGAAIVHVLRLATFGTVPARWFSQLDPAAAGLAGPYRWVPRLLRWAGWLTGLRLPAPSHVPVDRPEPILQWMTEILRAGGTPYLHTYSRIPGFEQCIGRAAWRTPLSRSRRSPPSWTLCRWDTSAAA